MKKGKQLYSTCYFGTLLVRPMTNNRWRGGIARARERQLGAPL
jgi:hypothetical protein